MVDCKENFMKTHLLLTLIYFFIMVQIFYLLLDCPSLSIFFLSLFTVYVAVHYLGLVPYSEHCTLDRKKQLVLNLDKVIRLVLPYCLDLESVSSIQLPD